MSKQAGDHSSIGRQYQFARERERKKEGKECYWELNLTTTVCIDSEQTVVLTKKNRLKGMREKKQEMENGCL